MGPLNQFIDIILHLDTYLNQIISQYGTTTYAILFAIIFAETGLVIAPMLPGDSLLFVAGAFSASGALNIWILIGSLSIAAILGDTLNYTIGSYLGPKVFRKESKILNHDHLEYTRAFYDKHGPKTIIIARFVPIVRTFAPFVAGIGTMHYGKFIAYNIIGGVLWVVLCLGAGYFFGNIPIVRENFTAAIMVIIVISLIPPLLEYLRHRKQTKAAEVLKKEGFP